MKICLILALSSAVYGAYIKRMEPPVAKYSVFLMESFRSEELVHALARNQINQKVGLQIAVSDQTGVQQKNVLPDVCDVYKNASAGFAKTVYGGTMELTLSEVQELKKMKSIACILKVGD